MEIEELKRQRDLAQSQAEDLRRKLEEEAKVLLPYFACSRSETGQKSLKFFNALKPLN